MYNIMVQPNNYVSLNISNKFEQAKGDIYPIQHIYF